MINFLRISFTKEFSLTDEEKTKRNLKPTGGRDDGRAEWREESVIISERLAEGALANVAEVTPLPALAASGPAEIQEWRK